MPFLCSVQNEQGYKGSFRLILNYEKIKVFCCLLKIYLYLCSVQIKC